MTSSIIIARLLGSFLCVIGLSALLNPKGFKIVSQEFIETRSLIVVAGILAFIPGLAIVNFHNVWVWEWPVLITVFGWILLLGGVLRIIFYERLMRLGQKIVPREWSLKVGGIFMLILGAFLTWKGYF